MKQQDETEKLGEIAVELGLTARALPRLAYVAELEAICSARKRERLEHIAARIGLSADATRQILGSEETRGELLGRAHRLIKALIPFEAEILALLRGNPGGAPR